LACHHRKGDLTVSHRNVAADTAIRLSRSLFERVASGQTNIFRARELDVARESRSHS